MIFQRVSVQSERENRKPDPFLSKFQPHMCPYGLAGLSGERGLGGFRFSRSQDIGTKQGTGYLCKVAGPWEGSAWVSMRDMRAGGRGAGDAPPSMPQHVETYMFPLYLGVCTLKFPSPVLGGPAKGLSLLGLMSHLNIYIYIYGGLKQVSYGA